MDQQITRHEAADILQWGGYALILVFAISVVFAAYPVALSQPEWLAKVSGSLRGGGSFALVGALMLLIATQLDSTVHPLAERLGLIRRLALAAAIGFALLIPLQTYAAVSLARNATSQERAVLRGLNRSIQALRNAGSEQALQQAISSLPGAPPQQDRKFGVGYTVVKQRLIDQLEPQARRIETQIGDRNRLRIMAGLQEWIREGLLSACYALGFAALGKAGEREPSLLESLTPGRRGPG